MEAENILDRFSDVELAELEKYYLRTVSKRETNHQPILVPRLLLRLTVAEWLCLAQWVERTFTHGELSHRVAA